MVHDEAPETRYAKSGGVFVAYSVAGDSPLDIVFLSSWISQIEALWSSLSSRRFFNRLSRFARVILLDKRGSGMSDAVKGTPSVDDRMDDIRAVMDAARSQRAALIGTSEGGPLGAFSPPHTPSAPSPS